MKGSSVDRSILSNDDIKSINNGQKDIISEKYKISVLKDIDFKVLDLTFNLSKKETLNLLNYSQSDADLLKQFSLTDYSLLVSIHKFKQEDYEREYKNQRIMKSSDDKYLYVFSIIDFLCVN